VDFLDSERWPVLFTLSIGNDGTLFYLLTNKDAPLEKIITIDIADPKFTPKDLVPEQKDSKLEVATLIKDYIVIVYKKDVRRLSPGDEGYGMTDPLWQVKGEIYIHNLKDGKKITRVAPDFVGDAEIWGKRENPWFFSVLTSFTNPSLLYQYRFDHVLKEAEKWRLVRTTEVKGLSPDDFISTQVWYESKDGTKVPMFIVRHKDTPLDGTAPALQYGPFACTFPPRERELTEDPGT
jgi:prolyl oligopeptidase